MHTNFGPYDILIIGAYLAMLTLIGVYFSRRQKNLEDFFLAGRKMSWFPIGLSLMAALNSGIDYIGAPSTTIKYGLIFTVAILSWFFLYPWVAWVTLPFYRRLQVFTAYEYLERRFGLAVRTLAAGIFLLWRIGWMATAMYVPCLAISAVTGNRVHVVPLIVALGSVVTFYTMLGGIKAVIWTDVIQFCIMLTGLAVSVIVVINHVPGGLGEIWRIGHDGGKTNFTLAFVGSGSWWNTIVQYFQTSTTVTGILITTVVGRMAVYCSDQVMVQRFQTTKSLADSRRAFIINAAGDAIWMTGLSFVGLALFAYFKTHSLPAEIGANTDRIFPYFMANIFPTGVIGLVIAAILAASLSSIDSAINSCTSVYVVDFYNRVLKNRSDHGAELPPDEQRKQILVSRVATLCFGIVGMVLATNVGSIGIVLEIGNKVIQSFTGPLLGIYVLGMFGRRTNSAGALAGGLLGTLMAVYVAFFSTIGFIWPTVFGLVATLIAGYVVSLLSFGGVTEGARELTWRSVMKRPLPVEVIEHVDDIAPAAQAR